MAIVNKGICMNNQSGGEICFLTMLCSLIDGVARNFEGGGTWNDNPYKYAPELSTT